METKEPIKINVSMAGSLTFEWWTPETAALMCDLCQKCKGWNSGEKPLDCTAGNPYCG